MLIQLLFIDAPLFFMAAAAILLALSIHEYFHAWTAHYLGDSTPEEHGRLTVNPFAHLDFFGTLLLFFIGIGWGKPVPINPYNLRNQKWGPALVSLAGPGSNFLMALLVGLPIRFLKLSNPALLAFFGLFVWFNLILGVFNLIPVPPLDGSHILFTLFPRQENLRVFLLQNSPIVLLGVILFVMLIGFPFVIQPLFSLIAGTGTPF